MTRIKPPSPSPETLKETLEENDKKLERSLASRNAVAAEPLGAKLMNMLNPVGNIMRSPGITEQRDS